MFEDIFGTMYENSADNINFPKYFERPAQVAFFESMDVTDEPHWLGGIALGSVVICGECGGTIELDDLDKLFVFDYWCDINEEIFGDSKDNAD